MKRATSPDTAGRLMDFKAIFVVISIAFGSLSVPVSATTLVTSHGKLAGATGLSINGSLYDVEFLDGTCPDIFSDCDSDADFAFTSQESAISAAWALFDQVLVGDYDANPSLTNGCQVTSWGNNFCRMLIPFHVSSGFLVSIGADNGEAGDGTSIGGMPSSSDVSTYESYVFARFTPSSPSPAVPEPATWAMMLVGFGAIGASMRRKRQQPEVRYSFA